MRGSSGMVSVGVWGEFMGVGGYGALIRPQNNGKSQSAQVGNKARAKTHNTMHSRINVNASNAMLECVGNVDDQRLIRDAGTSTPQYEYRNLADTKGYARTNEIPRENGR